MEIFKITNDGLLTHRDYVVPPFEILPILQQSIMLDDDMTFRDLVKFFVNYPDLHYVFPELKEVCEWVDKPSTTNEGVLVVNYQNMIDWRNYSIKSTKFEKLNDGSGMSTMNCEYDYDKPSMHENVYYSLNLLKDDTEYSITFTPIEELLDLEIKFNDTILSVTVDDVHKTNRSPITVVSLYDLILCVSDDVMFHGSEENKQERFDDLKEMMKEVDEHIKDSDDDED